MSEVLVIGAGIIGASVAYRLSRAGASVTVLEAERPAALASRRSFAWINAHNKPPRAYHDLNAAGLLAYDALAAELGGDWLHRTGNLVWATALEGRAALRANVERLQAWNYSVTLVGHDDAAMLAPGLTLPPDEQANFLFAPHEGWVEVGPLVGRLLAATTAAGGVVRWPASAQRLEIVQRRLAVTIDAGERIVADWVIDCAGCAAGAVLRPHGLYLRQRNSPGLLAVTEPAPVVLDRVVHTPGVYLRPDGNGRLVIGSSAVDATLDDLPIGAPVPGTYSAPARDLLLRARAIVPGLAGVELESTRLCWRPMPADDLSAVGPLAALPGYYVVLTHSGVTLAPYLASAVAQEIVAAKPDPALVPFRPDRLVGGQESQ